MRIFSATGAGIRHATGAVLEAALVVAIGLALVFSFAGVTGYTAAPGYDLASGWGTINAAKFVPALAFTASH